MIGQYSSSMRHLGVRVNVGTAALWRIREHLQEFLNLWVYEVVVCLWPNSSIRHMRSSLDVFALYQAHQAENQAKQAYLCNEEVQSGIGDTW